MIVLILVIFFGVLFLCLNIKDLKNFNQKRMIDIPAKCIKSKQSFRYSTGTYYLSPSKIYYPIYQYWINDKRYVIEDAEYHESDMTGTYKLLKINEDNPEEIITETKKDYILAIIVDFLAICIGLITLLSIF